MIITWDSKSGYGDSWALLLEGSTIGQLTSKAIAVQTVETIYCVSRMGLSLSENSRIEQITENTSKFLLNMNEESIVL